MNAKDVPIVTPCSMTWDDLQPIEGQSPCRFCAGCEKKVHNLSKMRAEDARELVETSDDLCVIYEHDKSGRLSFQQPKWLRKFLGVLAFMIPMTPMITACGGMRPSDHNYPVRSYDALEIAKHSATQIVDHAVRQADDEQLLAADE